MRYIENLCPPAFLYLLYIGVHVVLDLTLGLYATAIIKVLTGFGLVFLLDSFCRVDLGIFSWVIIATPFVITALASSIAMGLQLDRTITLFAIETFTGNTGLTDDNKKKRSDVNTLVGGEAPVPSDKIMSN